MRAPYDSIAEIMPIAKCLFLIRWSVILTLASVAGCDSSSSPSDPLRDSDLQVASEPATTDDYLQLAKRLERTKDYRGAADAVYKSLIQQPDNDDAKLVAARVERSLGNLETARDVAASIDVHSEFGQAAVELHHSLLLELNREEQAAEVLLAALKNGVDVPQWRHQVWKSLNRFGRRTEACEQAMILTQLGMATEHELVSLIMRTYSFPTPGMLPGEENGDRLFAEGLGKAKWYFTLAEYHRAIEELAEEHQSGFPHAEADALYGRLLAETQQWDLFQEWSDRSSEQARKLSDYWAGMGTFFATHERYEAATGALLEAIRLDPTDRISVQRLGQSLRGMGRTDDVQRFNDRAMRIYTTENEAQVLYIAPQQSAARQKLVQALMYLGRPFETLAWMLSMNLKDPTASRRSIERQREAFLADESVLNMATRMSLSNLDPADFDMQPAWRELLTGRSSEKSAYSPRVVKFCRAPRLVNRAEETGLIFQWYKDVDIDFEMIPIHEAIGGGIAVLDYDLDGWPDVYLGAGLRRSSHQQMYAFESAVSRWAAGFPIRHTDGPDGGLELFNRTCRRRRESRRIH